MLVLGRKPGEYVMIGEDIMVKVVKSDKGDLRLAIDAPREMNITRGEVHEAQEVAKKDMQPETVAAVAASVIKPL